MRLADPWYLLLLLAIPVLTWVYHRFGRSFIRYSSFERLGSALQHKKPKLPAFLKILALVLIIVALARPQSIDADREIYTEGIDILIALDVSGSMKAEDFHPENRLAVAKQEAKRFIEGRKEDRIGLVVFAQKSFTQCPLTLDYDILKQLLAQVEMGALQDGTAVGMGIANATNRLRGSKAKSKVIILLTDGENNSGNIDPITAAELAKGFGIKIYTIGIGKDGVVPFPVDDPIFGRRYVRANFKIDEKTLKQISTITGGRFFLARDPQSLRKIYETIDRLEKTKIEIHDYQSFNELYPYFLLAGIVLLLAERVLRSTIYLRIP